MRIRKLISETNVFEIGAIVCLVSAGLILLAIIFCTIFGFFGW